MQEITSKIIIETSYLGVTLGAIDAPHGLVLVDSPLKAEDARSWKAALLNLGGSIDRLLVNLDAHPDRTLGTRAMECTVVGHELISQAFRNRPPTIKSQNSETGSDWEFIPSLSTIRWNPPEISFSESMQIEWGGPRIDLTFKPCSAASAIWVTIPEEKVVFVGDAVVKNQPPFLSNADLPYWIESLQDLLSPRYYGYCIVSGRGGLVSSEEVHRQLTYLKEIQPYLSNTATTRLADEELVKCIQHFLQPFQILPELEEQYTQRLRWGISHYRTHEVQTSTIEPEE